MKKILSLILAVILTAVPMCVESYAADETNYDDLVAPCFTYLNNVSAGITEASLGFVTCSSSAVCNSNGHTLVLTCTLQRTDGTSAWADYKTKTETFTTPGTFIIEKNWFAPANYAYRVKTYVAVKNSSGTTLESSSLFSRVIYK